MHLSCAHAPGATACTAPRAFTHLSRGEPHRTGSLVCANKLRRDPAAAVKNDRLMDKPHRGGRGTHKKNGLAEPPSMRGNTRACAHTHTYTALKRLNRPVMGLW